jgi:tRNA 5-methylaminomethyl-2-thiouridine biosynthesis bifunctional protein
MTRKIEPAGLEFDADGHPVSVRYGDVYASRDGALGQARHVFLGGNDLPARWARRGQFVVLETGFGLGTNFLATWQAWRDDPARPGRLHFVSVEHHPLAAADLIRAVPAELQPLAAQLAEQWPLPLPGLHRLAFDGDAVVLTLALGDAAEVVPRLVLGADAFFLDGFAPDRNPDMWSPPLLKALARLARPGATLATWCTARAARDALAASGFVVERRPGFGHKREMLVARFAPRWTVRRHEPPAPHAGERRAVVVGAGLAGCAAAQSLARRGWQVEVLDAGAGPASGASALPWGLLHAQVSPDDNLLARLTRAGFLLGRQWLARLPAGEGAPLWNECGVLQQAGDEAEAYAMQRAAAQFEAAPQFVQWRDTAQAARLAGVALHRGGLWFGSGGVVSSRRWCRAMLDAHEGSITLRACARAARLAPDGDGWRVDDERGRPLATAPVLVLAAALDSPRLLGLRQAPVRPVRGRISLLRAGDLGSLKAGLAGDGYAVRGPDGTVGIGASYEFATAGMGPAGWASDEAIHRANLQRLSRLLADPGPVEPTATFDGVRCVAHDRLPLAGPVADEDAALGLAPVLRGAHLADLPRRRGLYASFALGSRGLTLAPLAGELVAAQLEGEPWPVARDLAAAIDPARFLLRRLRGGRGD